MQTITREAAAVERRTALAEDPVLPKVARARSLAFPAEMRSTLVEKDGQQLYHLSGIASVTDKGYPMHDAFGEYEETIDRGAFDETLAANPDVSFLVNHRGVSMARTTNGTLQLRMMDEGLQAEAWLNPKRQDVSDVVLAIQDRTVDQMSFAFMLEDGLWNQDFTQFRIMRVNIDRGDVSAVNYGANPYTSISARTPEILDDLDHLPVGAARAAMARLEQRTDITPPPLVMDLAPITAWIRQND